MRTFYVLLMALLPLVGNGQAYLGSTFSEIKANHPEISFKEDVTDSGIKIISASMPYGTFFYYFEKASGLSTVCLQIPYDMKSQNSQIEIYNKEYVIVSESSWKADLEGGAIMMIELLYDEKSKSYFFRYMLNGSSPPETGSRTRYIRS